MQRDLDALMDWGSTWGMKFNAKKCNIMRVSRSRKPLQHFYSLGNEILQEVSDAKYLGIQIDNKLDWNKANVSEMLHEMLHELGWQSLDGRRQDQRLVLFFKIINGLASVETEDILTPGDSRTRKNHSFKFKHLQANCDSYRYSFFPATISSWNNLPFGIEKVDSVEGFKLKLKEHTFRSP